MLDVVCEVTGDNLVMSIIDRLWAGFGTTTAGRADCHLMIRSDGVAADGERRSAPADAMPLATFAAAVNRCVVDRTKHLGFHCGVVSRGGRTVALAGQSGAGKSTLVAALASSGWCYVTDECLAIDDTGYVTPYPRPLGLSHASVALLNLGAVSDLVDLGDEWLLGPGCLNPVPTDERLRLTDIVFLDRTGHQDLALRPLPRAEAAMRMLERSFNIWQRPATGFTTLTDVLEQCRTFEMAYRDAPHAARTLAESLDGYT